MAAFTRFGDAPTDGGKVIAGVVIVVMLAEALVAILA